MQRCGDCWQGAGDVYLASSSLQIGPVSLPEDVKPGALVATLLATDADLEPAFRLMDFAIEEGDPEGIFDLSWEPDSDHVQLRLQKVRMWTGGEGSQVCYPDPHSDPELTGFRTSATRPLLITRWWWLCGTEKNWWAQVQALQPRPR